MSAITTPYDHATTAGEVVAGIDLSGRRVIVTGAASGIGVETARALAQTGAQVTLAVRDVAAGKRVAQDIVTTIGSDGVDVAHHDLADLASVDAFTAAWDGPLHVLVNNAGVMATPERAAHGSLLRAQPHAQPRTVPIAQPLAQPHAQPSARLQQPR